MATIKSCVCIECVAKLSSGLKNVEREVDSAVRDAAALRGRMEHSLSAASAKLTGDSLPQSPPQPQKKVGTYPPPGRMPSPNPKTPEPIRRSRDDTLISPPQPQKKVGTYPPPGRLPSPNPKTPEPDRSKTPFIPSAIPQPSSSKPKTTRCVRSV
eukprot:3716036-Rhodomonas_salina.1